jgi:hypothetical protein
MSVHVSKRPRYSFGGGTPAGGTSHAGHGFWSTAFTPGENIPDFSEMPDPSTYANPLAQNFGKQPSTIWKDAGPLRQPDALTEGTGQFLQPYPQGGQPPPGGGGGGDNDDDDDDDVPDLLTPSSAKTSNETITSVGSEQGGGGLGNVGGGARSRTNEWLQQQERDDPQTNKNIKTIKNSTLRKIEKLLDAGMSAKEWYEEKLKFDFYNMFSNERLRELMDGPLRSLLHQTKMDAMSAASPSLSLFEFDQAADEAKHAKLRERLTLAFDTQAQKEIVDLHGNVDTSALTSFIRREINRLREIGLTNMEISRGLITIGGALVTGTITHRTIRGVNMAADALEGGAAAATRAAVNAPTRYKIGVLLVLLGSYALTQYAGAPRTTTYRGPTNINNYYGGGGDDGPDGGLDVPGTSPLQPQPTTPNNPLQRAMENPNPPPTTPNDPLGRVLNNIPLPEPMNTNRQPTFTLGFENWLSSDLGQQINSIVTGSAFSTLALVNLLQTLSPPSQQLVHNLRNRRVYAPIRDNNNIALRNGLGVISAVTLQPSNFRGLPPLNADDENQMSSGTLPPLRPTEEERRQPLSNENQSVPRPKEARTPGQKKYDKRKAKHQ